MVTSLTDIRGVGGATVEKLKSVGVGDIDDLADKEVEEVVEAGLTENKARKIIKEARQSTVQIQTGTDVINEYSSMDTIPSGLDMLDDALGGGWEENSIIAVSGEAGAGKTQLAFQSLVSAVEETGKPAVYIETEAKRYRPERLEALSTQEDTQEKIHRIKAYGIDKQLLAYEAVMNNYEPNELSLVIIDSFTARFRRAEEFKGRGTLSSRSEAMSEHLDKLEEMTINLEIPVLMTAQIYENPSQYGKSEFVYGGSLFMHTVFYFIHMTKATGDLNRLSITGHPGKDEQSFLMAIKDKKLELMEDD